MDELKLLGERGCGGKVLELSCWREHPYDEVFLYYAHHSNRLDKRFSDPTADDAGGRLMLRGEEGMSEDGKIKRIFTALVPKQNH